LVEISKQAVGESLLCQSLLNRLVKVLLGQHVHLNDLLLRVENWSRIVIRHILIVTINKCPDPCGGRAIETLGLLLISAYLHITHTSEKDFVEEVDKVLMKLLRMGVIVGPKIR